MNNDMLLLLGWKLSPPGSDCVSSAPPEYFRTARIDGSWNPLSSQPLDFRLGGALPLTFSPIPGARKGGISRNQA